MITEDSVYNVCSFVIIILCNVSVASYKICEKESDSTLWRFRTLYMTAAYEVLPYKNFMLNNQVVFIAWSLAFYDWNTAIVCTVLNTMT